MVVTPPIGGATVRRSPAFTAGFLPSLMAIGGEKNSQPDRGHSHEGSKANHDHIERGHLTPPQFVRRLAQLSRRTRHLVRNVRHSAECELPHNRTKSLGSSGNQRHVRAVHHVAVLPCST